MKHICPTAGALLAFSVALAGPAYLPASAAEDAQETKVETAATDTPAGFFNTSFGIMIGTHKSPDSRFGEVFGDTTSLQFGLNLSRTLIDLRGPGLDLSLEARTISKTGKSTVTGTATKLSMLPLSAGGRLFYRTRYVVPFVGAGGDWYHYKETSALANTSGWARGYHVQGGVMVVVPGAEKLRIRLYYKHTKVTATINDIEVKLGGPEYGVGLSYGFNILNKAVLVNR